jgi:hypothetical protein
MRAGLGLERAGDNLGAVAGRRLPDGLLPLRGRVDAGLAPLNRPDRERTFPDTQRGVSF